MNPRCPECGLYELNDGSEDTLWTCECELDETPATPTAKRCGHCWDCVSGLPCPIYSSDEPTAPELLTPTKISTWEAERDAAAEAYRSKLIDFLGGSHGNHMLNGHESGFKAGADMGYAFGRAELAECVAANTRTWNALYDEKQKLTAELAEAKHRYDELDKDGAALLKEAMKLRAENAELRDFRRRVQAQAFEGQCLELEEKLSDIDDELQTANFDKATDQALLIAIEPIRAADTAESLLRELCEMSFNYGEAFVVNQEIIKRAKKLLESK
jgi:hypothetical protein